MWRVRRQRKEGGIEGACSLLHPAAGRTEGISARETPKQRGGRQRERERERGEKKRWTRRKGAEAEAAEAAEAEEEEEEEVHGAQAGRKEPGGSGGPIHRADLYLVWHRRLG